MVPSPCHTKSVTTIVTALMCMVASSHSDANRPRNIATVERANGDVLGPYVVDPLDHHDNVEDNTVIAASLTSDDEGSGYFNISYDDTEGEDDVDPGLVLEEAPQSGDGTVMDQEDLVSPSLPNDVHLLDSLKEATTNDGIFKQTAATLISPSTSLAQSISTFRQTTQPTIQTTPPAPSTVLAATATTIHLTTPVDSECHQRCNENLHQSYLMTVKPNVSMIQAGESIVLECVISASNVQLHWIFQGINPPQSSCALSPQQYIESCSNFPSIMDQENRNTTHLASMLTLSDLTEHNTGDYMCQAVVDCCMGIVQHQRSHTLTVWSAQYKTELLVMAGLAAGLSISLILALVYQTKINRAIKHSYMQVVAATGDAGPKDCRVVHMLPSQQDTKDGLDTDSFTSIETDQQ